MKLTLIGIGTGNPDHLTAEGRAAICAAEVILIPKKGTDKDDLAELRARIVANAVGGMAGPKLVPFEMPVRDTSGAYLKGVNDWHDAVALAWQSALAQSATGVTRAALLIWGDPSLYDSALRIAARLSPAPDLQVVPGITSLQALTAAHAIPLNALGAPVQITNARSLIDTGWPAGIDSVAVMLDGQHTYEKFADQGINIWWGAFLGMPEQILEKGLLTKELADHITARRAKARAAHGWIMDTYLLHRGPIPA